MILHGIAFVLILTTSFAMAMLLTRDASSGHSTLKRLVVIQESIHTKRIGASGAELRDPGQRSRLARLGWLLERYKFAKTLKLLLVHADSSLEVGDTVLISSGCALVLGVAGYLLLGSAAWVFILCAIGAVLPYGWLRRRRDARVKAFNVALPDAIDLMARALRAGHAIGSAIEMVAEQTPAPVSGEFFQVFQQQRLGLQFRDALLEMGARVPSRDLQFLITAILVQKETGGDLTEILDRAARVIRERIRIEGEVRTHTAQGRLTGWILGLLPVIMLGLINLISPGYSTVLFHDPAGRHLLYIGAVLIAVGALVIRKIVDVEV